jgi:hypothetical protein
MTYKKQCIIVGVALQVFILGIASGAFFIQAYPNPSTTDWVGATSAIVLPSVLNWILFWKA